VLLFSSDLALGFDKLLDYYCLRFQLEFNFRDAKQYWGLEDFMTTHPTRVTNAANLSLFMVNVVERVLRDRRREQPEMSVLDLKAQCRGAKYVEETIKLLPEKPEASWPPANGWRGYQPRVCRSCDSSRAAAARPFIVPVTCSLTSARTFGSTFSPARSMRYSNGASGSSTSE